MVEGNGLENRRARKGSVGSNPTLSANLKGPGVQTLVGLLNWTAREGGFELEALFGLPRSLASEMPDGMSEVA